MRDLRRYIFEYFGDKPAQRQVVELIISLGLSVKDDGIYLDKLKIPYSSLAEVAKVDRRVVVSAIESIRRDSFLKGFFERLLPAGPFLRDVARDIGYTVLIVIPYRDQPGIIAGVSTILAKHGINIVQIIAEAPQLKEVQKMYIVVEGDIPGEVINEIKKLDFIDTLQIM